jgi:hypothetical protein
LTYAFSSVGRQQVKPESPFARDKAPPQVITPPPDL